MAVGLLVFALMRRRQQNRVRAYRDERTPNPPPSPKGRQAVTPAAKPSAPRATGRPDSRADATVAAAAPEAEWPKPGKAKGTPAYTDAAAASPSLAKLKAAAQRPEPARKQRKGGRAAEAANAVRREARLDFVPKREEALSYVFV